MESSQVRNFDKSTVVLQYSNDMLRSVSVKFVFSLRRS